MSWWKSYLSDVPLDEVQDLFTGTGIEGVELDSLMEWVFDRIGLCRLAFASIIDTDGVSSTPSVPLAVISQTRIGLATGRPKTAIWAFWAGYIIRESLRKDGLQITHEFLSKLIGLLLARSVPSVKVRTQIGKLRNIAKEYATKAAYTFLKNPLKQELSEKEFKERLITVINEGLDAETINPPMVKNGKLDKKWVKRVVEKRRSILHRVEKHGPLVDHAPHVYLESATKIGTLHMNVASLNKYTKPKTGSIHFGKSLAVAEPLPRVEVPSLANKFGMSLDKNDEGNNVSSLTIPREALEVKEPGQALLLSVPVWLPEWRAVTISQ